jgi:hypothetical protein
MTWRTSLLTVRDVVKDVVLTSLGVVAIWSQIFSPRPNPYVIGAGLALTVPSTAGHIRALLAPGPGDGESSESTPPRPPRHSQRSLPSRQEPTDE